MGCSRYWHGEFFYSAALGVRVWIKGREAPVYIIDIFDYRRKALVAWPAPDAGLGLFRTITTADIEPSDELTADEEELYQAIEAAPPDEAISRDDGQSWSWAQEAVARMGT